MEEKKFLTLSETLRNNFWKIKKLSDFQSSCFINSVYTVFIHNERNRIGSLIKKKKKKYWALSIQPKSLVWISTTSSRERNNIFQNFQKEDNLASNTQIFGPFFPEVFFPFNFAPGISRILGWMVRIFALQPTEGGTLWTVCFRSNLLKKTFYNVYLCIPLWSLEFFATWFEYRSIVFNLQL